MITTPGGVWISVVTIPATTAAETKDSTTRLRHIPKTHRAAIMATPYIVYGYINDTTVIPATRASVTGNNGIEANNGGRERSIV